MQLEFNNQRGKHQFKNTDLIEINSIKVNFFWWVIKALLILLCNT